MGVRRGWGLLAATLSTALCAASVSAQQQPPTGQPGGQWATTTQGSAPAVPGGSGMTLDDKQLAALRTVSKFFNDTKQMKGVFAQTNPDGKKMRGRFALKQPGKFRFDYGFGSKLVITSDGTTLAIQDKDISSDDRLELDRTPFRILLRNDVDLIRDARIFEVQDVEDLIIVAVGDKSPDAPGKIRLFFTKKPALELKEWVTTDAQGADTRVEVGDLTRAEAIDDAVFKIQAVGLNKTQ